MRKLRFRVVLLIVLFLFTACASNGQFIIPQIPKIPPDFATNAINQMFVVKPSIKPDANANVSNNLPTVPTICTVHLGNPQSPDSVTASCKLTVIDTNTISLASSSSQPTLNLHRISPKQNDMSLSGDWESYDYTCYNSSGNLQNFTEQVNIQQTNDSYVATKITGDNCVPAGHITFSGQLVNEVHYNDKKTIGQILKDFELCFTNGMTFGLAKYLLENYGTASLSGQPIYDETSKACNAGDIAALYGLAVTGEGAINGLKGLSRVGSKANSMANASRLRSQLAAEEIASGHSYAKHINEFRNLGINSQSNPARFGSLSN